MTSAAFDALIDDAGDLLVGPHIRECRHTPHILETAQVIRHHAMADAAEGGQITGLFVAEVRVRPMMDFERAVFIVAVANSAPKARKPPQSQGA